MTWTAERIETATRLWSEGFSGSQVAAALGVTRNAAIAKLHRLGVIGTTHRITKVAKVRKTRSDAGTLRDGGPDMLPEPLPAALINAPPPKHLTIMQLTSRTCRWPTAGQGAETKFCGHRAVDGSSYCDAHRRASVQGRYR
jgi:GcrA cell cycle regulator